MNDDVFGPRAVVLQRGLRSLIVSNPETERLIDQLLREALTMSTLQMETQDRQSLPLHIVVLTTDSDASTSFSRHYQRGYSSSSRAMALCRKAFP